MHTTSGHTRAFGDLRDTPIGMDGDTRRAVISELQGILADHLALTLPTSSITGRSRACSSASSTCCSTSTLRP